MDIQIDIQTEVDVCMCYIDIDTFRQIYNYLIYDIQIFKYLDSYRYIQNIWNYKVTLTKNVKINLT